uniref:Uncharacterized protein n=1 Tax=Kalanchoe fedtschenkoi TaxID=63787 RepID=A0A7N0V2N4_KALFE
MSPPRTLHNTSKHLLFLLPSKTLALHFLSVKRMMMIIGGTAAATYLYGSMLMSSEVWLFLASSSLANFAAAGRILVHKNSMEGKAAAASWVATCEHCDLGGEGVAEAKGAGS